MLIATTGPIYADTEVNASGDQIDGMTLTKISETLYSLTGPVGFLDCQRIVSRLPDHPFTLLLESYGGSLYAGVCLAETIKELDVITVVRDSVILDENGSIIYQPDFDDDGYIACASACGLLFFAGDARYLIGDVYFGLHGPGITENSIRNPVIAYTYGVQSAARMISILRHLGVRDDVILFTLRIPSSDMYYLNPDHFDEMEGLRYIANHYVNFWGYTGTNPHTILGG